MMDTIILTAQQPDRMFSFWLIIFGVGFVIYFINEMIQWWKSRQDTGLEEEDREESSSYFLLVFIGIMIVVSITTYYATLYFFIR